MKKLQVYGTGCPTCHRLAELTEQAARELELEYALERVSDIESILALGVVATPALVVDGELVMSGGVPTLDQLKAMIA